MQRWKGEPTITEMDIALAAELALPHRMKGGPLQQSEMGVEEISNHIEQLVGSQGEGEQADERDREQSEEKEESSKKV